MNQKIFLIGLFCLPHTILAQQTEQYELITIADARKKPAKYVDVGPKGDSVGDMYVFDQPLLNEKKVKIGNNSGYCIRTLVGHSHQCQWTLTMSNGTIQVAGREAEKGSSFIAIVGGTGDYVGVKGQMLSTNNNNGTFTQKLQYFF